MSDSMDFGSLISGVSKGVSDFGSAAADLMGAQGSTQAAQGYQQAAQLAEQDATLEEQATKIKQIQQQRAVQQTLGSQRAEVGAAGFTESGSSLDLLANSASQGAITTAVTGIQGQILVNGYNQQAQAYIGQQQAAEAAAKAQKGGGFMSALGGIAQIAAVAAAPFTGGASLIGLAAGAVGSLFSSGGPAGGSPEAGGAAPAGGLT